MPASLCFPSVSDVPYFDANATTPLAPAARAAWLRAQDEAWHNPSSAHRAGVRVKLRLDATRKQLAEILDTEPERLIFTGGASEAAPGIFAHLARNSVAHRRVLLNPTEHPAVLAAAREAWGEDRLEWLPVTPDGLVTPEALVQALHGVDTRAASERFAAVVVMAAHNESGVLQPWPELSRISQSVGVPYVCDASQWVGKLPAGGFGRVDWMFTAGHKFGGPKGVGLVQRPGAVTDFSLRRGGGQERGQRGGTEDFPGIAAFAAAWLDAEQTKVLHETDRLYWRDRFERELTLALPGTEVVAAGAERLWNTVLLLVPHGENHRWVTLLDKRGFEVSTGSACASGKEAPSTLLAALGYPRAAAPRTLRVSASWATTPADWEQLQQALVAVAAEVRPVAAVVDA